MTKRIYDPQQKALEVNLNSRQYGTIVEIGAGQETARWFFRVGAAAGTIAKTMSAYDMTFSDAIYGPAPRYVSRDRLEAMLDHEYGLLLDRLGTSRGEDSQFFAFANTVSARSHSRHDDGHGWLGIRFQANPHDTSSQIKLHVNLHGKTNLQDQETLGILGVNLIYAALNLHDNPDLLLRSLQDNISPEQAELDMIEFSGQAFKQVDNRLMALRLVERGMSDAAMFTADGNVVQVADVLWQRPVLIERSRFRPPTHLTIELLEHARSALSRDAEIDDRKLVILAEMTLRNLSEKNSDEVDTRDFLNRADILSALGMNVLISNYGEYYRLAQYLFRYTRQPIAIAMGLPSIYDIFNERYYEHLAGGVLESFGRLFRHDLRLYVCPELDIEKNTIKGLDQFEPPSHLEYLFAFLRENGCLRPLDSLPQEHLAIHSHKVLQQLQTGDSDWEACVPNHVVKTIKAMHLFGYSAHNNIIANR